MSLQLANDLFRQLERQLDLAPNFSPASTSKKTAPRPSDPSPLPTFTGRLLSETASQPLTWLWPHRILLGHLSLLDAAPGTDPSLLALTLAASLSSGSPLPDGTLTEPGGVILYAPYDAASDTLKPRLQALGANLLNIMLFRPTAPAKPSSPTPTSAPTHYAHAFTLPDDLDQLAITIRFMKARLVILDPASAIIGLARHLPALLEIAQNTNCAILLLRSLRHPLSNPLHASAPASPALDAACSRLLFTPDPANENHTLLLTTHHHLCPQSTIPILAFATHLSADGLPGLHSLGERHLTELTRLCTGPLRSPHRQAILRFLRESPTPQDTSAILAATSYDEDAGRQMLIRMRMANELVSPARGLYTTRDHPCLSQPPYNTPVTSVTSTPEPPSHSVANVTSPSTQVVSDSLLSSLSNDTGDTSSLNVANVSNVTNIPSPSQPHIPTVLIVSTTPSTPVHNVTFVTDTADESLFDTHCRGKTYSNNGEEEDSPAVSVTNVTSDVHVLTASNASSSTPPVLTTPIMDPIIATLLEQCENNCNMPHMAMEFLFDASEQI